MFTQVYVDIRKLRDYCLNPHHPVGKHKARVFLSQLGIKRNDAQWLKEEIIEKIKSAEIEWAYEDEFGKRCSADLPLLIRSATVNPDYSPRNLFVGKAKFKWQVKRMYIR